MAPISPNPSPSGSGNRTTSPCFPLGHISLFGKHADSEKLSHRKIHPPAPDEDPHHLVDSREHAKSTRSRSPWISAHCIFYECKVSKDSAHKSGWNNTLLAEWRQVPPGSQCRVTDPYRLQVKILVLNSIPCVDRCRSEAVQVPMSPTLKSCPQ